jgi:deferrochelatase/peroxidase EfeB
LFRTRTRSFSSCEYATPLTAKGSWSQEKDSKELSDKLKPPTAHISRVVMEENGKELEIVRHSSPYDTVPESGLFSIAYTKNLDIPERLLSRRYGTAGDGLHDRLRKCFEIGPLSIQKP